MKRSLCRLTFTRAEGETPKEGICRNSPLVTLEYSHLLAAAGDSSRSFSVRKAAGFPLNAEPLLWLCHEVSCLALSPGLMRSDWPLKVKKKKCNYSSVALAFNLHKSSLVATNLWEILPKINRFIQKRGSPKDDTAAASGTRVTKKRKGEIKVGITQRWLIRGKKRELNDLDHKTFGLLRNCCHSFNKRNSNCRNSLKGPVSVFSSLFFNPDVSGAAPPD